MCGYQNVLAFKTFDAEDIHYIENFVRTKLPNLLDSEAKRNGHANFDEADGAFFFGHFMSNTGIFEFTRGERKLLDEIVLHIQKKSIEDDTHFEFKAELITKKSFKRKTKNGSADWLNALCSTSAGLFFGHKRGCDNPTGNQNDRLDCEQLKSSLFSKTKRVLENHAKKFGLQPTQPFASDLVSVTTENGAIKGRARCTYCDPGVSVGDVSIFFKQESNSGFWILSNMSKHLTKYHSGLIENKKPPPHIDVHVNQIQEKKNRSRTKNSNKKKPLSQNNHTDDMSGNTSPLSNFDTKRKSNVATNANYIDKENTTYGDRHEQTLELSIEPVIPDLNINKTDDSSVLCINDGSDSSMSLIEETESKHDALYSQMSVQIIKMSNAAANNSDEFVAYGRNDMVEMRCVKIDPNGSCLLSSLVHQLFQQKVNSYEHKQLIENIRKKVVEHIETNIASYVHCIEPRLKKTEAKIGTDIEKECLNFVRNFLSKENYWCGVETINAVSELYDVNVGTVTNDGLCSMTKPFNPNLSQTLLIFYINQNHYESIIELAVDNISLLAEKVLESEKKLLNLKQSQTATIELL